jgi:pimeloyl-ACP methyl ester carboxylesterase
VRRRMSREIVLDVRIAGRRLEAIDLAANSDRRPLVLLHEGLGSVSGWRDFPETLQRATSRRVIAYSRFGHGKSDPPPAPRTPAFFHEEAYDVLPKILQQLDVGEPVLVGHSDGASIALVHAGAHPVRALILFAPHVVVEDVTLEAIREARRQFESGDLRQRLSRHHDNPDLAFRGWCDVWLDAAFRTWTLEPDAERVDCPVLLIQGVDDPYGSLDQLDRIAARVQGPVFRKVVPGGHSPHRDARDEVLDELVRFLERVDGGHRQVPPVQPSRS